MTVQKNFKIVNGLEVNTNLIFADTDSNKVGIATTGVKHTLHVNGGIGATSLTVSGISTGAGVSWANIPKLRLVDNQVATANQTTFSTVYTVGLLDVYVNGVRLSEDEFTAVNGATVTLDDACFGGETVEFISYSPSGVSVGQTGISGITILEEGTPVGSPLLVTSINFVGASVTAIGSGIGVTVYLSDYIGLSGVSTYASSAGIATYATAAGISTYSSSAGIATYAISSGIATYSSSAGIATYATSAGISSYADSSGISTVSQGLTGTPNVQVGIVTATNVVIGGGTTQLIVTGDARVTGILTIGTSSITLNGHSNTINVGSGVTIDGNTGIISATSIVVGGTTVTGGGVTSITAGSGISVDQSTGNVTITATGGGGSSQWVSTAAGIHTLSNVGIGTTNPTSALTVKGNTSLETLNVSGITTFNNTVNFGPGGYISTSANNLNINASTDVVISGYSGGTKITSQPGANLVFVDAVGGDVSLYYQTSAGPSGSEKRLQTLGAGVTVTGTTFTNQLSVSGVSTFAGSNVKINSGNSLDFGTGAGDLHIYKQSGGGSDSIIKYDGAFNFRILSDITTLESSAGGVTWGVFGNNGVDLYYGNSKKFETLGTGVTVTGTTFTNQLSVSGIATANSFRARGGAPGALGVNNNGYGFFGSGDNDSGMYSSADGEVEFYSNSSEVFRYNGTGVGIGTTNPTSKLTVRGGDISVGVSTAHGVILTSPNGTQYRLIVDDSGTLSTVAV